MLRVVVPALCLVCLLALAGCRGSGPDEPRPDASSSASSSSASSSASTSAGSLAPGAYERELRTADGRTRTYRLHVPASLPAGPVPLVIGLHGGTGSGAQFASSSGMDAVADARGFVAVYPDGTGALRTWNAGLCCGAAVRDGVDDVAFVRALIDEVSGLVPVDPRRVHVIGHSNGAMLAYRLACEAADRVVSVGLQAGNLQVSPCRPAAGVSLLHLHGTDDTNVPIAGGTGTGISNVAYPPVADGLAALVAGDGCDPTPARTVDAANPDVRTTTWRGGRDGAEVRYVEVTGATHAWMGRAAPAAGLTGRAYEKLDATTVLVDFVLAHPRP